MCRKGRTVMLGLDTTIYIRVYTTQSTTGEVAMGKAAAIEFLEEQLIAAEAEVQAIKLVLARHRGLKVSSLPSRPTSTPSYSAMGGSVADLAHRALKEAGKPQTTEQLLAFLGTHGKRTTSATLRSSIYQFVRQGKRFKRVAPGLFGLAEWPE